MTKPLAETCRELREMHEKATPGPYEGRFIHRVFESARKDSATLWGTEPEQDWADCHLMAEAVNALPQLLDAAERSVWQPVDSLPEKVRVILTYNFKDVYAGHREGSQFFDGSWEVPAATHYTPLPEPPAATVVSQNGPILSDKTACPLKVTDKAAPEKCSHRFVKAVVSVDTGAVVRIVCDTCGQIVEQEPPAAPEKCEACGGKGVTRESYGAGMEFPDCKVCNDTGKKGGRDGY